MILQERLQRLGKDRSDRRPTGRLDALIVVSPPRSCSPPERTEPHARLLHLAERALDSSDARRVRACADFAEEALEVVLLQPRSRVLEAFCAYRGRDAGRRRARAV